MSVIPQIVSKQRGLIRLEPSFYTMLWILLLLVLLYLHWRLALPLEAIMVDLVREFV